MNSIANKPKPERRLPIQDWRQNSYETCVASRTRTRDSIVVRHEARKVRDESDIGSNWSAYRTNGSISDRELNVRRWKDVLVDFVGKISQEIDLVTDEKAATERQLDSLDIPFAIIADCLHLRDSRLNPELTHDYVDLELRKELDLLDETKKLLTLHAHRSWEQINGLSQIRLKLNHDVGNKNAAIDVDKQQLDLDEHCTDTTFKYEQPHLRRNVVAYNNWIENNDHLKYLAENELAASVRLRDVVVAARDKARNDVRTQRDRVDYFLRKRVYETQSARNELQWQLTNMKDEIGKMHVEIDNMEACLAHKSKALKLVETRFDNRYARPALEKVRDDPDDKLQTEMRELRQMMRNIVEKINSAK